MARTTKSLTNTEVKQSKPREKEYNLADGDGLKLRVKPNGSKLWLFNYYKPYTKKRSNMGLGSFPAVSLAEARRKCKDFHELLAKDIDPKEHRDKVEHVEKEAHNNTFECVVKNWLTVKRGTISSSHAEDIWRSFEIHVFPRLGKIPLHKIEAKTTIDVLKPIAAKGSLETVRRVCQRLNEVMVYGVNTGLIKSNPLAGIKSAFAAPSTQNMPSIMPEELPELLRVLSTASIKRTTRCLIEWQLHTMVRPSEAAGAEWSEFNFDKALWEIPAERMKKKRAHVVPLTRQALALLEVMKPISGHLKHVFPADRNKNKHANAQTANMAIKRMGYEGRLVAHGLRALASTTLNDAGFDGDVVEAALAHFISDATRAAYCRGDFLERRGKMMMWWSEYVEQAAKGDLSLAAAVNGLRVVCDG